MSSADRAQLRRIVADRLESLQQAGVLQLQRAVIERQPVEPAVERIDRGSVAVPARGATDVGNAAVTPITLSESRPVPDYNGAASADATIPMTKKTGWQPAQPTSLFESPKANSPSIMPELTLEILQQQVAACTRCNELASTRTQTVFGVGNPESRLCFLGEAPGADEDKTGIPFVGRAGQLLTKIIEACKLKRDDVYILNMIKCRPPGNRNPLPDELANCRGFLESQLDLIRPEFMCCLGAVAAQNFLGTTLSIGKLRGKLHNHRGVKVVCTYHPAFLLRSPSYKKETWEDMKLLMREMGMEL